MSLIRGGKTKAGAARSELFAYEVRRDGRPVATLLGVADEDGATVEAEVFPVTQAPGQGAIARPFHFASAEAARRFADEALVALEYLNCEVVE